MRTALFRIGVAAALLATGYVAGRLTPEPVAQAASVTPQYFDTMGIPLIRGRNFGAPERPGAPDCRGRSR